MFIFQRKNKNVGEIHVIVTKDDRVEHLIEGTRWINMNECLNDFNKDPDINEARLTAVYAGDIECEDIKKYISNHLVENQKQETSETIKKKKTQKVDNKGRVISCDDEDDEKKEKTLSEILSDYDLECPECGDKNKALVDSEGNIKPCESCMKIDAYLKGKTEAYKLIYKYLSENKDKNDIVKELLSKLEDQITEDCNLFNDENEIEITRGE